VNWCGESRVVKSFDISGPKTNGRTPSPACGPQRALRLELAEPFGGRRPDSCRLMKTPARAALPDLWGLRLLESEGLHRSLRVGPMVRFESDQKSDSPKGKRAGVSTPSPSLRGITQRHQDSLSLKEAISELAESQFLERPINDLRCAKT